MEKKPLPGIDLFDDLTMHFNRASCCAYLLSLVRAHGKDISFLIEDRMGESETMLYEWLEGELMSLGVSIGLFWQSYQDSIAVSAGDSGKEKGVHAFKCPYKPDLDDLP